MNFLKAIGNVCRQLDAANLRYALIGGFAMAMRGVQRLTVDLDFILMSQDISKAHHVFQNAGYRLVFKNENVSHYQSDDFDLGRIDILHAFRGPTLSMLERCERIAVAEGITLPVVQVEDIIGLKVQALVNDSQRSQSDWSDIRLMLECCAATSQAIDWELLSDYLSLFDLDNHLNTMKNWYGSIN